MKDLQDQVNLLYKRMAAIEEKVSSLSKGSPSPSSPTRSIMDLKDIMEAKERKAGYLRNEFSAEVATGRHWSNEEKRQEYRKLRAEIRDLNNSIASL
jgi:hypothetical protein